MKCGFDHKSGHSRDRYRTINVLVEDHGISRPARKLSTYGGVGEKIALAAEAFLIENGPRNGIDWFEPAQSVISFRRLKARSGYVTAAVVPFRVRIDAPSIPVQGSYALGDREAQDDSDEAPQSVHGLRIPTPFGAVSASFLADEQLVVFNFDDAVPVTLNSVDRLEDLVRFVLGKLPGNVRPADGVEFDVRWLFRVDPQIPGRRPEQEPALCALHLVDDAGQDAGRPVVHFVLYTGSENAAGHDASSRSDRPRPASGPQRMGTPAGGETSTDVHALDRRLYRLGLWADQLASPDRHVDITLQDEQWEVSVYTRAVDHPEVEIITGAMGEFGVVRAGSRQLAEAVEDASGACGRVVRGEIGDEATRAALGPTLMGNPLVDSTTQRKKVLDALVQCHQVLKLANDGDEPGERCVHDLGVWLVATDRLVQRIQDDLLGVGDHRRDLHIREMLRELLNQASPCLVSGVSSVGEPPAAGEASSDSAAGEGVS